MSAAVELKFGTSGLRGLATDLGRATCHAYTHAFLSMLKAEGLPPQALCIAGDLRASSSAMANWCAEAAQAVGVSVVNGGFVPTPALARYALRRKLPAMMITASHNPAHHNGIKFYRPDGELTKKDEAPIRALVAANGNLPDGAPASALPPVTIDVAREYVASFADLFPADVLRGLRIGVDQHSAVGRDLVVAILEAAGAECTVVRRSAEFVAIDTEALEPEYFTAARGWLSAGRFDAIVSTDGDGDRPLLLDETGAQVLGDTLGILAARFLGFADVVTPVSSTSQTEACEWFANVTRTRIGSPFVIAGMEGALAAGREAVAGFEGNGGFLVGGNLTWRGRRIEPLLTRDAILPILAVLALANERQMPLSALVGLLPRRRKATGRLADIDTGLARSWIDKLIASPPARAAALPDLGMTRSIETMDGAKFLLGDGSTLHFRLSGNAPELRCYVETADQPASDDLLSRALESAESVLR